MRRNTDPYTRRSTSHENRANNVGTSTLVPERRYEVPLASEDQHRSRSEWDFHGPSKDSATIEHRRIEYRYRSETRVDSEELEKHEQLQQRIEQQPIST
ncbi:hypothetical protein COOONC_14293, partial [Cooperia oncophora]